MAEKEGFECPYGIENRQVIDSKISTMLPILTFEGFSVQNRVQDRKGERTFSAKNVLRVESGHGH
jgi:hypothetical protein